MKRLIIVIFMLITTCVFASKIASPPPLPDTPVALQHYLKDLYENLHAPEVVTSSPDGSVNGKKGEMLFYISGSTYRLYVNTDSSQSWEYIDLSVGGAKLTQEQVDDYVDELINDSDSVHTRVTIKYDDTDDAMDFIVDAEVDPTVDTDDEIIAIINASPSTQIVHEAGGIEADISGVAIGDIIAGTGAGTTGLVTSTGHSDGDVLTRQADGSVDYETPAAGGWDGTTDLSITSGVKLKDGYLRIGDAGTVNYADGDGDLYVEDELEVDGLSYFKDRLFLSIVGNDSIGMRLNFTGPNNIATTYGQDNIIANDYISGTSVTYGQRFEMQSDDSAARTNTEYLIGIRAQSSIFASNGTIYNYGFYSLQSDADADYNYGIYAEASGASTENWAGYFAGDVKITTDLKVEGNDINVGDAGGFSGIKFNPTDTTLEFWIDGAAVSRVNAGGDYEDLTP